MKNVYNFLLEELKNEEGTNLVAAISGGPDSMALLKILIDIREKTKINIICAHVNHNLREESKEEKVFVETYCKNNNIEFEFMKIENYNDDNFHNQARTIRYNFFEGLVAKHNAKFLLTAHHGDDLMETILMRITRGSTIRGYAGFSKKINQNGYTMLRPLIYVTKDEIMKYIEENNLEYRIDKSNAKDTYTRNRYRKYVLPFLKNEDKNVNQKFLKYSETLLEYNEYIEKTMFKKLNNVYKSGIINIEELNKEEKIIKTKMINYIFEDIYDDDLMLITDAHTKSILDMAESKKPNQVVYLPNKLKAVKSYNLIKISKLEENENYKMKLEEIIELPNNKIIKIVEKEDLNNNNICRLNKEDYKEPLYIRNKKDGDKIEVKGLNGTKKIKDIFIDEKIPKEDRELWPILVDDNDKILFIPGLKKSKFNQEKDKKCDIIIKYE